MKQKISMKDKEKLIKQINGKSNDIDSADKNKRKKIHCNNLFQCQKRKSRFPFIQLKPILDIFSPVDINTV
jgi:hypothetical protein